MNRYLLCLLFAMSLHAHAIDLGASPLPTLSPTPKEERIARISNEIIARYEYNKISLNQNFSEKVFDRYLKILDPERLYLLESDVKEFSINKDFLADEIQNGELHIPFDVFQVYQLRVIERMNFANKLLQHRFNFDRQESFHSRRDTLPWATSNESLHDSWRKRVKNDWLRLKLAGENHDAIYQTLTKRYRNNLMRITEAKSEDVFQLFMDAYATSIDPHTNYLGLQAARELDTEMRLSMVGVGVVLEQVGEYMVIREIVPGSPAALSKKLNIGDRVTGLGEGEHGPVTDVVGWRVDDAITLAQGASGSIVRLQVAHGELNAIGNTRIVTLVRKKVHFEDQAAKMTITEVRSNGTSRKIAVISLPIFYEDFEGRGKGDPDYKSATRDVEHLLLEAKNAHADGVLLDLRNNGGGSLDEAIGMAGLFIGSGPVLQVRDANGDIKLLDATASNMTWTGSVGVLINRNSASASEIFAAAMQDYGRGIVIGETSFGKGTVQALVDLDKIMQSDTPEFGELKITIAQFFRVSGSSTQLRGVTPDLAFPSAHDSSESGEASFDNALPWAEVPATNYARRTDDLAPLKSVQRLHDLRTAKDKGFQAQGTGIAESRTRFEIGLVSLNEKQRKNERHEQEARRKLREVTASKGASHTQKTAQDSGLEYGDSNFSNMQDIEKAERTAKDAALNEAVQIVVDSVNLLAEQPPLNESKSIDPK